MSEPYSGTVHGPGTSQASSSAPPPPSPRGFFVRSGGATRVGLTMGSTLAMVISWDANHSILWALVHGLLSWIYVLYYALTRG